VQFRRRRELKRTRIEIIPMIDTMFFLLVFFMLSSLALTRMNGLPVNLPQASTAPKQPPVDLTVTIDRRLRVFVNKQLVAIGDVGDELQRQAGEADLGQESVVINADKTVPHGMVVQCIDEARNIGISKFAIATEPEGSKE
jgi:biopolymer transport protein ExbD